MSRREEMRQAMLEDIKAAARRQMAESGTAAVSLSAIARSLDISQPALYRYYASRDELITALIVDAYNAQAAALEAAAARVPESEHARQLLAVLLTYRDWALANPVEFQLIYGNPIPDYQAPYAVTASAARRNFNVLLAILHRAYRAGSLRPPAEMEQAARALVIDDAASEDGAPSSLPPMVLYLGITCLYHIHGMIALEMFHHTDAILPNAAAFYRHEVEALIRSAGMQIDSAG